jgi:Tfp pilus assembly PilM family ATPase
LKKELVGLDIGSWSVKAAVMAGTENGPYLKYAETEKIPENGFSPSWLKSFLIDFARRHRLKRPVFCLTLPPDTQKFIIKFFTMPKLAEKELAKSIKYELESRLLQPFENTIYRWAAAEEQAKNLNIVTAVAEKDHLRSVTAKGIRFASIEPQPVSILRLIKTNAAVIDFGHTGTRIMIYRNGKFSHMYVSKIGGRDFTELLAKISDDPETLKHEKGAVTKNPETDEEIKKLSKILNPLADELALEIKQAVRAWEAREESVLETVYYTGGASKLHYLPERIGAELEQGIFPVPVSFPDKTRLEFSPGIEYAPACGACLYERAGYLNELNFRSLLRSGLNIDFRNFWILILSFGLTAQGGLYALNRQAELTAAELRSELAAANARISDIRNRIQSLESSIMYYSETERLVTAVKESEKGAFSSRLRYIAGLTPKGVTLTEITDLGGGEIELKGKARDYARIGFFAIALEQIGRVELKHIGDELDFTIKVIAENPDFVQP